MSETLTNRTKPTAAAAPGPHPKPGTGSTNDPAHHPRTEAEIISIHASQQNAAAAPGLAATASAPVATASANRHGAAGSPHGSPAAVARGGLGRMVHRFTEQFLFNTLVGIGALAAGILWWHYATTNKLNLVLNFQNVPAPLVVWDAFLAQLASEDFYTHIMVSLQRVGIAFAMAAVIGIALGLIGGRSRIGRAVILPYVEIFRPIPAVAWIPLSILMWPTEEASIIYITFLGALFPIIINTMHGVDQTPEVLIRAARSLGAGHSQIFRYVVLPAALPSIATGLAVAMGVAWFSLLAGEIISGQYGIGYFTWNAYSLINYPDIVVGMLCIGFLGTLSTYGVRAATKPFLRWQERTR